ncbi:HTH_Tnp_Tc3_2 domain-containing protein [Trichonephila clavipes]|nr:HTH_Tnp_Tc3_2 domain-containing protein [Trichonephila clavipes]
MPPVGRSQNEAYLVKKEIHHVRRHGNASGSPLLYPHSPFRSHFLSYTDPPPSFLNTLKFAWGRHMDENSALFGKMRHSTDLSLLFKKGKSYREIAKIVGRSHSCVQKIIGRFKSDGLIENKSGRGRKSILSDVAKRKVLKDIKIDPKLSAVKLELQKLLE